MGNDSTTFVVMGDHHWNKGDYLYDVIGEWLKAVNFEPRCDAISVTRVKAKPDEVSVDGMGGISYPEGAKVDRELIRLTNSELRKWLPKLRKASDLMDEAMFMVTDAINAQSALDSE